MAKMKRTKKAASMIGAALLLTGGAAQAGEWQVQRSVNGNFMAHYDAGGSIYYPNGADNITPWTNTNLNWTPPSSATNINKVDAWGQSSGTVDFTFIWLPGFGQTMQTDPPPPFLFYRPFIVARASAISDNSGNHRDLSKETVEASATYATVTDTDSGGQGKWRLAQSPFSPPAVQMLTTGGSAQVAGSQVSLYARAEIDSGRTFSSVPGMPAMGLSGNVETFVEARVYPFIISSTTPAIGGNPLLGQNEFTMVGGGAPFAIPCNINLYGPGADAATIEYLRQQSSWTISRALPNPLAGITNGATNSTNYGTVFPQFRSDQGPPPGALMQGLGFSTLNGLPSSNGDFGARSITHTVLGTNIGTADIEIFYRPLA